MHSLKTEPTKLILVGTRTTDQAIGDVGPNKRIRCMLMFHTMDRS